MALTTSAKVKTHLGITGTTDDTFIAQIITQADAVISRWCGREIPSAGTEGFSSATFTEYFDGRKEPKLYLPHTPVTSVTSVHDDVERAYGSDTLVPAADYDVDADSGQLALKDDLTLGILTQPYFSDGTRNVKVVYVGGWSTIPSDLDLAAILLCAHYYEARRGVGISSLGIGQYTVSYEKLAAGLPGLVKTLLEPFRRQGYR